MNFPIKGGNLHISICINSDYRHTVVTVFVSYQVSKHSFQYPSIIIFHYQLIYCRLNPRHEQKAFSFPRKYKSYAADS